MDFIPLYRFISSQQDRKIIPFDADDGFDRFQIDLIGIEKSKGIIIEDAKKILIRGSERDFCVFEKTVQTGSGLKNCLVCIDLNILNGICPVVRWNQFSDRLSLTKDQSPPAPAIKAWSGPILRPKP